MELQLVKGIFSQADTLDILAQLVQVKIRFHEGKIEKSDNEEDIKMREQRIKQLQQSLHETKQAILANGSTCSIDAIIKIN